MSIVNRLFGRNSNKTSGPMTDDEAMKIINAYGKALINRKSSYGELSDLP